MKPRLLFLLGLVYLCVSVAYVQAAQDKKTDEVEGSADVVNPDDEDFAEDSSSGLPPDDEDHSKVEQPKNIQQGQPKPTQPPVQKQTTVVVKSPTAETSAPDMSTILILIGVFILVLLIIVCVVVCIRKKSRKSEYTRGTRQQNAYV